MKPPVQWNCEGCEVSGHLSPPMEPIMEQVGEIEIPETDKQGKLVYEFKDGKDDKGKPIRIKQVKMKKEPRMGPKMGKMKKQDPVTSKVTVVDIPQYKDLSTRIRLIQLRMGDETITRYMCQGCLKTKHPVLKAAWDALEGMNA